ncbi:ATP-binding protein [Agrobacterium tumefaciens]|uniref:ATPase AAA-type core domain-containing protein n=1 Tax=Agrobacterium tumefaciens str. Kerr 14 TaxID=1183424 RepID=A0A1S7P0H8_AGRTU|nr:AAA family ATPase [Agrobacterium tumefaciens]AYM81862.1 hypothetical protein At12D1_19750 [Agrobacterium tumefaciens]NTE92537.1 ATP-binding protein [Agrobacterium tumefaciens]CUX14213.1 conserved hypothetical protein [Agrobacterium tumefaciens str. Kerr 14]
MLEKITFKFGSGPTQPPLEIETPPSVTVFVGPNNSGKSQALRELSMIFRNHGETQTQVLGPVTFKSFSDQEAEEELRKLIVQPDMGESLHPGQVIIKSVNQRQHIFPRSFKACLVSPNDPNSRNNFVTYYASSSILSLDGPSRIQLTYSQQRGDLKAPQSAFANLLLDNEKRETIRKLVHDATGLFFVLDASVGDHLNVRFGRTPPPNERSLEDETLSYMKEALGVDRVSDGVKAFTGILIQLHAGRPNVITVDEPEAFLHPNLAFTLGKELAKGAVEEGKHIFVATHSAQFLMGAISSGAEVNIVRLTYQNGIGTARLLPSRDLKVLMQDPLLRSVGVLEGLFFDAVLVGEANADRAFYQEINERLLSEGDTRGSPRTLFLNADNKQTIPRIIAPLRKLGIPAAGVVDIDVLKDGGNEWTKHLRAIGIPEGEHAAFASRRLAVLDKLRAQHTDFKTTGGVELLAGADRELADNLLGDLERYGLFTVPIGEVEAWLRDLDVERTKQRWLRGIFERMGSDPTAPSYIRPTGGDVWDFLGRISSWAHSGQRRGIPD